MQSTQTKTRNVVLICAVLTIVTLGLYLPCLHHDFINFDDDEYITANPHLQDRTAWTAVKWAFSTGYASNWHPLTWLSHILDYQIYGLNAGGHHLTNILLHTANTLLLFALLLRLTGATWRSAAVAALFAWHPLHVESVAWAAERKDVLSSLFFLLTLLAYTQYARLETLSESANASQPPGTVKKRKWFYLAALVLFCCGLMSKPMVVTVPFVLLLLDFWPLNRWQKFRARLLIEKVPFVCLSVAICIVTLIVQKKAIRFVDVPFAGRLSNAIVAYAIYLGKTLWPEPLAIIYPYYDPKTFPWWQVFGSVVLSSAATYFAWRMRRRTGYLTMGWLWFIGMLIPVIGIVQVGPQSMADRYSYLPLIGIFIAVVWGVANTPIITRPEITTVITTAIFAALCIKTHFQLQYWQNSERLFRYTVQVTKQNNIAYNNLGCAVLAEGRKAEAADLFSKALKIRPDVISLLNMGRVLTQQGNPDRAIGYLKAALEVQPDNAPAYFQLGMAQAATGSNKLAIASFEQATKLNPEFAEAYNALGLALTDQEVTEISPANVFKAVNDDHGGKSNEQNNWQKASECFSNAIKLNPNYQQARLNLGNVLADAGKNKEAISVYKELLRLNPTNVNAHYNLATAFAGDNRKEEAAQEFIATLKLNPRHAMAHNNLGSLLLEKGEANDALAHFNSAMEIEPNVSGIRYNAGTALLRLGKANEARMAFQEAVKLDPGFSDAMDQLNLLNKAGL
jgi:tetratricopeptide (TPR) repeat protein